MEEAEPKRRKSARPSTFKKSVLDALTEFEIELHESLDTERTRADNAEQHLAETEKVLKELRRELESVYRTARTDAGPLVEALRVYLDETYEAQRALLAITRRLLGLQQVEHRNLDSESQNSAVPVSDEILPAGSDSDEDQPKRPSNVPSRRLRPEAALSAMPINGSFGLTESELVHNARTDAWLEGNHQSVEEQSISEDQRLIDFRNQMDMSRLDSIFRPSVSKEGIRRRRSG